VEQGRQFLWGATGEVLGGEGIDGEIFDPEAPAPAHDLAHLLLAKAMAILLRHPTGEGEAAVAIHNDGHMGGDRAVLHPFREQAVVQQPEAALETADLHGLDLLEVAPGCPCALFIVLVLIPCRNGDLSVISCSCSHIALTTK